MGGGKTLSSILVSLRRCVTRSSLLDHIEVYLALTRSAPPIFSLVQMRKEDSLEKTAEQ